MVKMTNFMLCVFYHNNTTDNESIGKMKKF